MADSVSSSADADADATAADDRAPRWVWGFVLAGALGLLALVCPWFEATATQQSHVRAGAAEVTYYAWSHGKIGLICPFVLIGVGWQWLKTIVGERPSPFRVEARQTIVVGAVVLTVLGICRLDFRPSYTVYDLHDYDTSRFGMTVHPAIGCWLVLIAGGLFVVFGVIGWLVGART